MKTIRLSFACLLGSLVLMPMAFGQRRVITNEDLPSSMPAAPAAPAEAVPVAQPAGESAAISPAGSTKQSVQDENAAKLAAAQAIIRRMTEIRAAMMDASDIFFDKIREATASEPTINKWNQVRDNLVLAADELNVFIEEARRNLPVSAPPAPPAESAQQPSGQ